jgi:hydrogenase maturation factor
LKSSTLPLGKLPPELLTRLLARGQWDSARVVVGPGVGLDCAVLDFGDRYLVAKSDPITFATDEIGWYAVQINANDIACSGAAPQFFMATVLLPHAAGNAELAESIFAQIRAACAGLGAVLVGGHTEITFGLDRPIVAGTMLGEVARERLITAAGAQVGDAVLLTKGYPIEAVSIIAREFRHLSMPDRKQAMPLTDDFLARCRDFLHTPGISVVKDARVALQAAPITAMHDPTEGGVAAGLWELAEASALGIEVNVDSLPLLPEGDVLCRFFGLDPLGCIASGALLITTPEPATVRDSLEADGIAAHVIGRVVSGQGVNVSRPVRDEIAKLFS